MGDRPHRVEIAFDYPTAALASVVECSVAQEVGAIDDERSVAHLARTAERLDLTIEAADLIALRAAANTWLGLIQVAEDTAETVDF